MAGRERHEVILNDGARVTVNYPVTTGRADRDVDDSDFHQIRALGSKVELQVRAKGLPRRNGRLGLSFSRIKQAILRGCTNECVGVADTLELLRDGQGALSDRRQSCGFPRLAGLVHFLPGAVSRKPSTNPEASA